MMGEGTLESYVTSHNCLHNKAHPQHLGGHWFFCPLYHQSRIIYLLPFSDCSCFLMPSTVAVSRISPMEGDRRPPPLLQPLPRPPLSDSLMPRGTIGPADSFAHELALFHCSPTRSVAAAVCSSSAGTPGPSPTLLPSSLLPCHHRFPLLLGTLAPGTMKGQRREG